MSVQRHQLVVKIFLEASELPPQARTACLDRACGDDASLRSDVERLLAKDENPPSVLHRLAIGANLRLREAVAKCEPLAISAESPALAPPEHHREIGPYRLVRKLGAGGIGVVYLAEQEKPVRRAVAIKLIQLGMNSREIVARFEAERQALAMMDHPNIAQIFEAGATADGQPYFVMEHVPGERITDYCDQRRLPIDGRLELFMDVCGAVQHSHERGIIHRDLKVSNVLVAEVDGHPQVKVIDFGIAKAVGKSLTDETMVTELGAQIGTPEYMSPEQASLGPASLDTRTDIYALGVLLYELLTGTLPIDSKRLRNVPAEERSRIIREEEPPTPSTRLAQLGAKATAIGESRCAECRTLVRHVRGDLDGIVMKAMSKDRGNRYATVAEMAADVRRHLRNEPISARPPTALYRVRKFTRRNPVLVYSAALLLFVLTGGVSILTVAWSRAVKAQTDARRQAEAALETVSILKEAVQPAADDQARGRAFTVREALIVASEQLDSRATLLTPEVEAGCRSVIGETCWRVQLYGAAERHIRRAIELTGGIGGTMTAQKAELINTLAGVLRDQERLSEAEPLYAKVVEFARKHVSDRGELAIVITNHALSLLDLDRFEEALPLFEEALQLNRTVDPASEQVSHSSAHLSNALRRAGRPDEAEARSQEGLRLAEGLKDGDGTAQIYPLQTLLWVEQARGNHDRAAQYAQRLVDLTIGLGGARHPSVGIALINLADVQVAFDRAGAEESLRRAIGILREHAGSSSADLLQALDRLLDLLRPKLDAADEISQLSAEAEALRERTRGQGVVASDTVP